MRTPDKVTTETFARPHFQIRKMHALAFHRGVAPADANNKTRQAGRLKQPKPDPHAANSVKVKTYQHVQYWLNRV